MNYVDVAMKKKEIRDITITIRINESLDIFLQGMADKSDHQKAKMMFIALREWCEEHGYVPPDN